MGGWEFPERGWAISSNRREAGGGAPELKGFAKLPSR